MNVVRTYTNNNLYPSSKLFTRSPSGKNLHKLSLFDDDKFQKKTFSSVLNSKRIKESNENIINIVNLKT